MKIKKKARKRGGNGGEKKKRMLEKKQATTKMGTRKSRKVKCATRAVGAQMSCNRINEWVGGLI